MLKGIYTIKKLLLLPLFFFLLVIVSGQSKYVQKYKPLADSLSKVYKIPSAVILGIAIIESSSGQGRNAKLLNNHFGIVGKNNLQKTKGIKTRYKQYPNTKASYVDFVKMISRRKYYLKLKGEKNYKVWIVEISKHGYSEAPEEWRKNILTAIKNNKLQ